MIEAVHLYVDGDNLLYLQKERGWWIDQKKFLDFFKKRYPALSEAYYYSSLPTEGKEGVPRKKFFTLLSMLGYRVVTRVPKAERKNGMVAIRGCSDMLMCRDIILDLDRYGTCILVTGDGDFSCVIETLRARGKNFLVVSSPPVIGEELRKVAGMNYLDLEDVREEIQRTDLTWRSEGGLLERSGENGDNAEEQVDRADC